MAANTYSAFVGGIMIPKYEGGYGWDKADPGGPTKYGITCFDLAALVISLPKPVVLKLNCEGAEYPLLDKLHDLALDATLERCLVQWHDERRIKLRCPTEEYP